MAPLLFLALLVTGNALKVNEETDTSPIRKVVKMMEDMRTQLEKEAKEEAELFEKAMCMCDGGEEELKKTIAHMTGEVDRLTSKQEAEKAERAKLISDVDAHKTDLEQTKKGLYEAEEIRMKDAKKYQDDEMMNQFSIDSITQAL